MLSAKDAIAKREALAKRAAAIKMLSRASTINPDDDDQLKKWGRFIRDNGLVEEMAELAEWAKRERHPVHIPALLLVDMAKAKNKSDRNAVADMMCKIGDEWRNEIADLPLTLGVDEPPVKRKSEPLDDKPATQFPDLVSMLRLKKKQRRLVELLIERGGTIPLKDLAMDESLDWGTDWENSWGGMCTPLNVKFQKAGLPYRLTRHDNNAVLRHLPKKGQK